MKNYNNLRFYNLSPLKLIALTTFLIIFSKWTISYFFFPTESILIKNIFDLQDPYYFPFIINLAELEFNPRYLNTEYENGILPIPIYSIAFHSISYIIFKDYSFIIVEFLALFLFIYIFFKIFVEFNINTYPSILMAVGVFILPDVILYFSKFGFDIINFNIIKDLYSLRAPRPLITNLYFFWGLFLAIKYYKSDVDIKLSFLIGLCLALTFGSYYFNFVILLLLYFFLFLLKNYNQNKNFVIHSIKKLFISLITFTLISLPFLLILFFTDIDYPQKVGTLYLDISQKKIVVNYLLSHLGSLKFLLVFVFNTLMFTYLRKRNIFYNKHAIKVIYILFLSSFISPILFILFSPAISEIYHFIDLIVVIGILTAFIFSILFISIFVKRFNWNKNFFLYEKKYIFFLILFLIVNLNINYFNKYQNTLNEELRHDMLKLEIYFKKNEENLNSILTFIPKIQVWWLFNGKRKLASVDSSLTSLGFEVLELNFINNLKFLKISEKNFVEIIKNKKVGWKYDNPYIKYLSWYKYQANSLTTYKNSKDFDPKILNYISKSRPTKTQQLIVPNKELKRLVNSFQNNDLSNFNQPDIIIINKNSLINKYANINTDLYCSISSLKFFKIYVNMSKANCKF